MKIISKISVFTILLLVIACGGDSDSQTENQSDSSNESIIKNAVFTDLEGNEVNLDDFEGSLVLIDFWETWCGPCLQVFPAMQDLREEYPDKFEVLAVTVGLNDDRNDAKQFIAEHDYDFQFLYDENEVFNKLGGQGIPFKVYVDPDGNLIKIEMGSYGIEGDYKRTKELIQKHFEL